MEKRDTRRQLQQRPKPCKGVSRTAASVMRMLLVSLVLVPQQVQSCELQILVYATDDACLSSIAVNATTISSPIATGTIIADGTCRSATTTEQQQQQQDAALYLPGIYQATCLPNNNNDNNNAVQIQQAGCVNLASCQAVADINDASCPQDLFGSSSVGWMYAPLSQPRIYTVHSLESNTVRCYSVVSNGTTTAVTTELIFRLAGDCNPQACSSSSTTELPTTQPTMLPTTQPTRQPTLQPTTVQPTTIQPTTMQPTLTITEQPTTGVPTTTTTSPTTTSQAPNPTTPPPTTSPTAQPLDSAATAMPTLFNSTTTTTSSPTQQPNDNDKNLDGANQPIVNSSSSSSVIPGLVAGALSGILVIVVAAALWIMAARKKRQRQVTKHPTDDVKWNNDTPQTTPPPLDNHGPNLDNFMATINNHHGSGQPQPQRLVFSPAHGGYYVVAADTSTQSPVTTWTGTEVRVPQVKENHQDDDISTLGDPYGLSDNGTRYDESTASVQLSVIRQELDRTQAAAAAAAIPDEASLEARLRRETSTSSSSSNQHNNNNNNNNHNKPPKHNNAATLRQRPPLMDETTTLQSTSTTNTPLEGLKFASLGSINSSSKGSSTNNPNNATRLEGLQYLGGGDGV